MFASQMKGTDFNKSWPVENKRSRDEFVLDKEMRDKLLAAHPTIKKKDE